MTDTLERPVALDPLAMRHSAQQAVGLLKLLGNEDRLLLLCELSQGECGVSELEQRLGIRQPTLSQQLAVLRADLQSLGFERQSGVCEPEDHLAALCEVMAVLITEQHPDRNRFYERHLAPWVLACCRDQQQAKGGSFCRAVGALAEDFFKLENELRLPFGACVVPG